MNRRTFLTALVSAPAVAAALAACGDNTVSPAGTGGGATVPPTGLPDTGLPDTTVPAGITHATGAGDVVLRLRYEGGFVAPGTLFTSMPTLLLTGDGRAIEPGASAAIYPGPLLPTLMERSIDEQGVQAVLAAAAAAGLLTSPPDYTLPDGIGVADAPDTVLLIEANNATYEHRAYALGMTGDGAPSTPARDALQKFVTDLGNLEAVAGAAHLGAPAALVAAQYRFQATVVDPADFGSPQPTVVPWPASTGVALADAAGDLGTCATVDADAVGDLFSSANQLTLFQDAGVVYQLAVIAVLPGDAPCP
jgi:hypothetical protein